MLSPQDPCTVLQAKITTLEQQLHQCQTKLQQLQGKQETANLDVHEILEQVPSAIARVRLFRDYRIEYIYCSRGHEAVFGYAPEAFVTDATLWLSRVALEDRETVIFQTGFERIFAEQPFTVEYRFCCQDGSLRWISSTFSSQQDKAADCWIATGVSTDITHLKEVEATLRQSEENFRLVAENIHEVLFVESADAEQVLYVSPVFEKIWQVPHELLYCQHQLWFDAIHPADQENVLSDLARRKRGEYVEREFRIIRPGGEIRWLCSRSSPVFNPAGHLIRHVGIAEDITERKHAQQKIQFQSNLLDHVRNAVICTDVEGEITYWNRFAETLYQWKAVEAIGQSLLDLVVPSAQEAIAAARFERLRATHQSEGEYLLKRKDGTMLAVLAATTAMRDEAGAVTGFVGISVDISDRKQIEAELAQSEVKYRLLFENNPSPMWIFDVNSLAFLAVNDAAVFTYGYSRSEFLSMTIAEILPTADVPALINALSQDSSAFRLMECKHRKHNGAICDVEISSHAMTWENKAARFILAKDISDRKQAEAALQQFNQELEHRVQARTRALEQSQAKLEQQQQQLKTLVENTPDIIARFDPNLRYRYINPVIEQITGIAADQFIGKTQQDLGVWQLQAAEWSDHLQRVFASGLPHEFEFAFSSPAGMRQYQSKLVPEFAADGSIASVLAIARDITSFKQAQAALYQSEQKYATLAETVPVGIFYTSPLVKSLYHNSRWLEMTGLTEVESQGLGWLQAVYPDDRDQLIAIWRNALQVGSSFQAEHRLQHRDGSIIWVVVQVTPRRNDAGQVTGYLGTVTDISERKQIEAALQQSEALFRKLFEDFSLD